MINKKERDHIELVCDLNELEEQQTQLIMCNKCMQFQLNHKDKGYDCKCSLDGTCSYTRGEIK